MGSLTFNCYHFYFLMILKEMLTFLSLSNPVLQYTLSLVRWKVGETHGECSTYLYSQLHWIGTSCCQTQWMCSPWPETAQRPCLLWIHTFKKVRTLGDYKDWLLSRGSLLREEGGDRWRQVETGMVRWRQVWSGGHRKRKVEADGSYKYLSYPAIVWPNTDPAFRRDLVQQVPFTHELSQSDLDENLLLFPPQPRYSAFVQTPRRGLKYQIML